MAGLFYLGSGAGLSLYRLVSKAEPVRLPRTEAGWFAGAILAGGVIGPVLLMYGLSGMLAYGVSLVLFVVGLRHLGTARAGAYFSVAPFCGALIALAMGEPLTTRLSVAGTLMAIGIWLHLTEKHEHEHTHEAMEHTHEHIHDGHHQHDHDYSVAPGVKHSHTHRHQPISHTHAHFPDVHHVSHPH